MKAMGCSNGLSGAHMACGNANRAGSADRADGAPSLPAPSAGPAYLEGRLVLSLSFKGEPDGVELPGETGGFLERYRLWDDLAGEWHNDDLEVLRFERVDIVVRKGLEPSVLWEGAVDTKARVIPVPDLDGEGMDANRGCDLRWRRV